MRIIDAMTLRARFEDMPFPVHDFHIPIVQTLRWLEWRTRGVVGRTWSLDYGVAAVDNRYYDATTMTWRSWEEPLFPEAGLGVISCEARISGQRLLERVALCFEFDMFEVSRHALGLEEPDLRIFVDPGWRVRVIGTNDEETRDALVEFLEQPKPWF